MKILIVDDIAANLKLLRAILESEGHEVTEAADGVDALALLESEPVDAIISDILMPRMDGYRLCYEVRSSDRLRRLPFIFYTSSYTSDSDEKLALAIGGDRFLTKPAAAEDILQALHLATTQPRVNISRPSRCMS
jgi:CheY-like chemotaxis protein